MLIETYNLEIEVSSHSADEFEYEAIVRLPVDIRQVLPYLNAKLRSGTYLPDVPAFSWRKDEHKIAFWPDRIAVDRLESREQATVIVEELVKLVNDIWDGRGQIVPESTGRENLQPLELYRLLPRTNCKQCGEASCFNFALKLAAGQIELEKCEPLFSEEEYREWKSTDRVSLGGQEAPALSSASKPWFYTRGLLGHTHIPPAPTDPRPNETRPSSDLILGQQLIWLQQTVLCPPNSGFEPAIT